MAPLTGELNQRAFGQATGMEYLAGLFGGGRGDSRAVIRSQDDDLLMGQTRQNLAHGASADPEHMPQAFFGETAGRADALLKDGVEDPRIDIIHRWLLAVRSGEGQGSEYLW
ncbi:hypothetical protein TU81_21505 [Pseudomonas lini]|nr:hypothetical protein TU81_21505 [Pseudomonas lini]